MNKIFACTLLLFAFTTSVAQIQNGSFESGTANLADNWTFEGNGTIARLNEWTANDTTLKATEGNYFMAFTYKREGLPRGLLCNKMKIPSAFTSQQSFVDYALYVEDLNKEYVGFDAKILRYIGSEADTIEKISIALRPTNLRDSILRGWGGFFINLSNLPYDADTMELCFNFNYAPIINEKSFFLVDNVNIGFHALSAEEKGGLNFSVWPNPASNGGIINISLEVLGFDQDLKYSLTSMDGRIISNGSAQYSGIKGSIKLPENLAQGIYILQISNAAGQSGRAKVVVQE